MAKEYKNKTAEDILSSNYCEDPAWHIRNALSWLDYSERKSCPVALHYAGLHLRLAIEHLWFNLFGAARGGELSQTEYKKAIKSTTTLYQLIDQFSPYYTKFTMMWKIIDELDAMPRPKGIIWNIPKLKRIHGKCSSKTLHFQGVISEGYPKGKWIEDRQRFLYDSSKWMWDKMRSGMGIIVYKPETLKSDVLPLWERYRDGEIDEESLRHGLNIILPIVKDKPPS